MRTFGSGSLVVRADANGAEIWYGLWRTGSETREARARSEARARLARRPDELQAEAELRRRMQEQFVVIGRAERKPVAEAGAHYVEHLANGEAAQAHDGRR